MNKADMIQLMRDEILRFEEGKDLGSFLEQMEECIRIGKEELPIPNKQELLLEIACINYEGEGSFRFDNETKTVVKDPDNTEEDNAEFDQYLAVLEDDLWSQYQENRIFTQEEEEANFLIFLQDY